MGKPKEFQIEFDKGKDIYDSGEVISGTVCVKVDEDKLIRGISLKFIGQASVRWTRREKRGKNNHHTVHYTANETYFDYNIVIFGNDKKSSEKVRLPVGVNNFPFKFHLPDTPMPCSFEGAVGHIRYVAKATIDRPWKFDHVTKRAFSMVGVPYDLNKVQNASYPVHCTEEKTICCLCCATGPITATCNTDKRAYVPGETIYISCNLDNHSNRNINDIKAELVQSVTYSARRHGTGNLEYRTYSDVVTSVPSEGCGPFSTVNWTNKPLVVPPVPAIDLEGCGIITAKYIVKVTADVSSTPFDVKMPMDIFIGTVPLEGTIFSRPTLATNAYPPTQFEADGYTGAFNGPTFVGSAFGTCEIKDSEDNEHTYGHMSYTPLYTYYGFPGQTSIGTSGMTYS